MVGSTFKTMYLVSKSDVDNSLKNNFKLSLQNNDICDGGMSVSVKPIKTRKKSKDEKSDKFYDDDEEDEDGGFSNFKQQYRYSKPTKQIPPNYGFSLRDANMEQRRLVNYDKPKQNSEESSNDERKIYPIKKLEPRPIKAKYRKERRWNEIKQLKRQRSESDSENENNGEQRDNTAHMDKRQLVKYDQLKHDSTSHLDMEESSNDSRQDEKNYDNDSKKYITNDEDQNSDNNKNNKIDEGEDKPTDESMNKSDDDIDQFRQRVKYGKKRKRTKMRRFKRGKIIAYAKQLSKNHRPKDRKFDGKSSIQIDPTETNLGREDIQSDENEKRKFDDNVDNQPNSEVINLKRRKILDDINKLKDDQWMGRIKSRLNDKRVQFKRKQDTVGYRINTDDVSKSLIKPSDFTYLNRSESADFLDKWKPLNELRSKPVKNKRFKLYH